MPEFMRYELGSEDGATHAVAVAPGVWTMLSPGTGVRESADSGSLTGYCASVEKFERQSGEDRAGTCW